MHSKIRLHFALLMEKVFHRLHGLFIAKFQGRMTTIFHKVIIDKSRGEVSLMEQDTIENVS